MKIERKEVAEDAGASRGGACGLCKFCSLMFMNLTQRNNKTE